MTSGTMARTTVRRVFLFLGPFLLGFQAHASFGAAEQKVLRWTAWLLFAVAYFLAAYSFRREGAAGPSRTSHGRALLTIALVALGIILSLVLLQTGL